MDYPAENNVVFDAFGSVCVDSCENCPFLTPHMGEHCVLRPSIDMKPLYQEKGFLPKECPLRPGGLEVILDCNRDEELAAGRRYPSLPTGPAEHKSRMFPPPLTTTKRAEA